MRKKKEERDLKVSWYQIYPYKEEICKKTSSRGWLDKERRNKDLYKKDIKMYWKKKEKLQRDRKSVV